MTSFQRNKTGVRGRSAIPGGGVWITNEYDQPIKIKLVHSVTLSCYEEQTIEPPTRYYETPYGEFTIGANSFFIFTPYADPPPDVIEW